MVEFEGTKQSELAGQVLQNTAELMQQIPERSIEFSMGRQDTSQDLNARVSDSELDSINRKSSKKLTNDS